MWLILVHFSMVVLDVMMLEFSSLNSTDAMTRNTEVLSSSYWMISVFDQ